MAWINTWAIRQLLLEEIPRFIMLWRQLIVSLKNTPPHHEYNMHDFNSSNYYTEIFWII
jgi:hypothetical protein